ncbi:MAG: ABC transporter ATP-binding protein, partial [Actinobacteria bacterium]|nr:ABC transporter ATP-binding protein [Actinomycetota bacterium]NIS28997.1 ABC transporter ATP-binding protein [Actinomycetota bacterium]NIU17892.1 ABC transporter ATP-binding protein [Actinomycetota bacterium]NIU64419.1 ABC transporter ATP-binding protein [Actinomycetota bacterium]NIW26225.1 ABC transporter ATP-binding protein [Actinomycetota bacterium]
MLDEPTSGVSPLARSALWDAIRRESAGGAAVLVSTHYMDEAEQADRVVVMSRGRVIAEGVASDIVGDAVAVEISATDWRSAFDAIAADDRLLTLDGTAIRVVGE